MLDAVDARPHLPVRPRLRDDARLAVALTGGGGRQASAVSKAVRVRVARLNSTPMRWTGWPSSKPAASPQDRLAPHLDGLAEGAVLAGVERRPIVGDLPIDQMHRYFADTAVGRRRSSRIIPDEGVS